ncbi:MAG: GNAT family N-acetyltransferase [Bacteroidales bacterium]|nr:GNAT family N-acetyltransferase [Bacteroidales bacterium]
MILKAQSSASLSSGEIKLYAFSEQDVLLGCVELYNYDPINLRAAVGIVVVPQHRGCGHGLAMLKELTQFCLQNTSLHQIFADIAATNQASVRLFQKAGYQCCGTFRDWVSKGDNFVDSYRYQLLLK